MVGQTQGEEDLLRNHSRTPRLYELMTILSPDVAEEEIPSAIDRIAAYIVEAGGTVNEALRESPWGRRRLAYPIRHSGRDVRDGFYTVFHFDLDPRKVDDVERELRLNDRVIRHLMTHYTPVPVEETAEGETVETTASDQVAEKPAGPVPAGAGDQAAPTSEEPAEEPAAAAAPAGDQLSTQDEALVEEPAAVAPAGDDAPADTVAAEQEAESTAGEVVPANDEADEADEK
ncbi:MAG: 30S ribosomal protein S6 [Thermomicrobiales bacterium]